MEEIMKVMYIDETSKNIFTEPSHPGNYVFGGVVIKKDDIHSFISKFKYHTVSHERKLRMKVPNGNPNKSKMFNSFEFHAKEMLKNHRYNPNTEKNVWCYYSKAEKFQAINNIIADVDKYVEKYLFYVVNKENFIECYSGELGKLSRNRDKNNFCDSKMIETIITDYNSRLFKTGHKGLIVPDELDSNIREMFLNSYNELKDDLTQLWLEPITVFSHKNAFTQYVDIITYLFNVYYSEIEDKSYYSSAKKIFTEKIKEKIEIIPIKNADVKGKNEIIPL